MKNLKNFFVVSSLALLLQTSLLHAEESSFIKEELAKAQQDLPLTISNNFILEKINLDEEKKELNYETLFIDLTMEQLKSSNIVEIISPAMTEFMCADKLALQILQDDYTIRFNYNDKYGDYYGETRVSKTDCINFYKKNKK